MAFTKVVGASFHSVPAELNAEGQNVPIIPANMQWVVDDPSTGQLTVNSDGSCDVKGLKPGSVNLFVKDLNFITVSNTVSLTWVPDNVPVSISQTIT